ncbi:dynamin family protein [Cetobacterium sp. SF1]|uniref:dynamin family protein n=1 Tax=Cetobacterium sp. SF1 TaxID=3417654 RepID=UPI003CED7A62
MAQRKNSLRESKIFDENDQGKIETIEIKYNPYTYYTEIKNSSVKLNDQSKLKMIIKKNKDKALYFWYKELIGGISEDFNTKNFKIIFNGRGEDYSDILDEREYLNKNGWNITSELNEIKENKNVLTELTKYVDKIKETAPEELKKEIIENKAVEEFENAKKSEAEVSIIATMSSGKSTLLNAILGKEILPSKNEACTATICRIKDVDGLEDFRLKVETLDGEILSNWKKATLEDMDNFNEEGNTKGINLFVEGDIPGINSEEMNLILIDTPGPNNSQNMEHKEATYKFIKDTRNNPLVLYVMNATQHGTNDDARLLSEISDIVKNNGKQAEERFIFALNKIDCFDPEKESIETLIDNSKKYLKSFGIDNPKIFPLSAEAAKLIRLRQGGESLSRAQKSNLKNYEYNFLPEPSDDYPGIDTIKYASIPETMKEKLYDELGKDREQALLNYSGITAIELYIDRYVNKYAKSQKVKDSISTLKKVVDNAYSEVSLLNGKTTEEIERILKQVEEIETMLRTRGSDKLEEVKENIKGMEGDTSEYGILFDRITKAFRDLEKDLSDSKVGQQQAKLKIENANKELEGLIISLKTSASKILSEELLKKSNEIIDELKKYFEDILGEIDLNVDLKDTLTGKFELNIPSTSELMSEGIYSVDEYVGQKYVKTRSTSKWWNPFSWGSSEDIYEDIYEKRDYVDLSKINEKYFEEFKLFIRSQVNEIQDEMFDKIEEVKEKALENVEVIEENIQEQVKELKNNIEKQQELSDMREIYREKIEKINCYKKELDQILDI